MDTMYRNLNEMTPAEKAWEVKKSKMIMYALTGKMAFWAVLVWIMIWGQSLSMESKLNLIFGSGLLVMTSIMLALFRSYTREEIRHNVWLPLDIGVGIAICIWALYSLQVSPPSL